MHLYFLYRPVLQAYLLLYFPDGTGVICTIHMNDYFSFRGSPVHQTGIVLYLPAEHVILTVNHRNTCYLQFRGIALGNNDVVAKPSVGINAVSSGYSFSLPDGICTNRGA